MQGASNLAAGRLFGDGIDGYMCNADNVEVVNANANEGRREVPEMTIPELAELYANW